MNYISDCKVNSINLIQNSHARYVADFTADSELVLLRGLLSHVSWSKLAFFAKCAANSTGCGFEVTGSRYDNEFDLDEERWTGVQISNSFDDEPIVISTQAYEKFCLHLLDFAETVAKAENQPILNEPVWSEIVENRERLRSRLQHEA